MAYQKLDVNKSCGRASWAESLGPKIQIILLWGPLTSQERHVYGSKHFIVLGERSLRAVLKWALSNMSSSVLQNVKTPFNILFKPYFWYPPQLHVTGQVFFLPTLFFSLIENTREKLSLKNLSKMPLSYNGRKMQVLEKCDFSTQKSCWLGHTTVTSIRKLCGTLRAGVNHDSSTYRWWDLGQVQDLSQPPSPVHKMQVTNSTSPVSCVD